MQIYKDLHVDAGLAGTFEPQGTWIGWKGACFVLPYGAGFSAESKGIREKKLHCGFESVIGALISVKTPEEVQKKARSALESGAEIILVEGGDEEINRAAAECWEVDVLCHPERVSGKDLMDQKFSGIDDVMARFMAERMIALEINLSWLLSCYGTARTQLMGRMKQNIMLAKKYGTPLIITSGAADSLSMRAPQDIVSLGVSLGMDAGLARKSITDYPAMLLKKSRDRRSANVLLAGLEVVSWGGTKHSREKKLFGWY